MGLQGMSNGGAGLTSGCGGGVVSSELSEGLSGDQQS